MMYLRDIDLLYKVLKEKDYKIGTILKKEENYYIVLTVTFFQEPIMNLLDYGKNKPNQDTCDIKEYINNFLTIRLKDIDREYEKVGFINITLPRKLVDEYNKIFKQVEFEKELELGCILDNHDGTYHLILNLSKESRTVKIYSSNGYKNIVEELSLNAKDIISYDTYIDNYVYTSSNIIGRVDIKTMNKIVTKLKLLGKI